VIYEYGDPKWNDTDRGNKKLWEKPVTLSTTDSATRARIRASAVRDRLSYGTAFNQCGQSSGGRVRSFTQPASSSSSPWLSSLTYHPGGEKQARWWPRFWDVSPHRRDQSLKSCHNRFFRASYVAVHSFVLGSPGSEVGYSDKVSPFFSSL
jgi:hypothetical protein